MLNKAHLIEITKACTTAFKKARNSLAVVVICVCIYFANIKKSKHKKLQYLLKWKKLNK